MDDEVNKEKMELARKFGNDFCGLVIKLCDLFSEMRENPEMLKPFGCNCYDDKKDGIIIKGEKLITLLLQLNKMADFFYEEYKNEFKKTTGYHNEFTKEMERRIFKI